MWVSSLSGWRTRARLKRTNRHRVRRACVEAKRPHALHGGVDRRPEVALASASIRNQIPSARENSTSTTASGSALRCSTPSACLSRSSAADLLAQAAQQLAELRGDLLVAARQHEQLEEQRHEAGVVAHDVLEARDEDRDEVVGGLRLRERRVQRRHPHVAVVAHDLDEQPLLRAEVVVQQPARHARRPATWSNVDPAVPRSATDARIASTIRAALSPASWRSLVVAASITGRATGWLRGWLAGQQRRRRPAGRPPGYGGHSDARSGRRRGRLGRRGGRRVGGVVELLLGAEQRVEHLVAQALADGDRRPRRRRSRRAAGGRGRPCASSSASCAWAPRAAPRTRRAARRRSFLRFACSFLSSMRFFAGDLPWFSRLYAFRAASKATTMLSRSSSSWMTRCRYGFSFAAWAAAAALAALSFAAI